MVQTLFRLANWLDYDWKLAVFHNEYVGTEKSKEQTEKSKKVFILQLFFNPHFKF